MHFADDRLKCNLLNEKFYILIQILLNFVPGEVCFWRSSKLVIHRCFNSSPPGFRRQHFQTLFMNENVRVFIQISLKFVPKGPIDDKSSLVQVMAWPRSSNKQLPEPVKAQFSDAHMWTSDDKVLRRHMTSLGQNKAKNIRILFWCKRITSIYLTYR